MSRNNLFLLITLVLSISQINCHFFQNHILKTETGESDPSNKSRIDSVFKKGENALAKGDIPLARQYFDRAIDLILDSHVGSEEKNILFDEYVKKISVMESSYLQDISSKQIEEEKAFLDEIIDTPLFSPSEAEINQFRKKIDTIKPQYSVPMTINSSVVSFIRAFQNIRHKAIQNALNKSAEYIDDFKKIFREFGIPEDLAYLPIIESGFRVHAVSRARAVGMWQFMSGTARLFGLKVDWLIDERKNPYKAAVAAAKFLKDLHDEFGDWYLALACYNGGSLRIRRAISVLGTKDFFEIAKSRLLKRETQNYVPAFLASLVIAKSPEEYGFSIENTTPTLTGTKVIQIISPVDLSQVSTLLDIPLYRLKELNPELIRSITPANQSHYDLRVPDGSDENLLANLSRIQPPRKSAESGNKGWYHVRHGDSLYGIAKKFRVSVKHLKKVNGLVSNHLKPGTRLMIPPRSRGRL